jgi:hypothetical protein
MPTESRRVAETIHGQGLPQVLLGGLQVKAIAGGVAEAQHAGRRVDDETLKLGAGRGAFALQQAVDQAHRRAHVVKEVADADADRLGHHAGIDLRDGFDHPEVRHIVEAVHDPVHGLQRVRDGHFLLRELLLQFIENRVARGIGVPECDGGGLGIALGTRAARPGDHPHRDQQVHPHPPFPLSLALAWRSRP